MLIYIAEYVLTFLLPTKSERGPKEWRGGDEDFEIVFGFISSNKEGDQCLAIFNV